MSLRRFYLLKCDRCGDRVIAHNGATARRMAKGAGWKRGEDEFGKMRDVCEKCLASSCPEAPGLLATDCSACTGAACLQCGPYPNCGPHPNVCEHDVMERHEAPRRRRARKS